MSVKWKPLVFRGQITLLSLMKGTKEPGKKFDFWSKSWNAMEMISTWCNLDQNVLQTILISRMLQGEN